MGRNGYRHYQIRLVSSNHDFFEWCKNNCPTAHVEEATTKRDDYERKSGMFLSSYDTPEIRSVRFGSLNKFQEKVLRDLEAQNVRQIDVYYDKKGNLFGKSWFVNNMWEHGKAHYLAPFLGSGKAIVQDIADKM